MDFEYEPAAMAITGTGEYTITLAGGLSDSTGDLNLYKLASNYLDDVPLLSGGTGDTGDMKAADVVGDGFSFTWIPPDQPSHFPQDRTDSLSINVIGQFNNVDTAAMGFAPIAPAFKPSLQVDLISQEPDVGMIFGGIYDVAASQDFWKDNVGITPVIPKSSSTTEFRFDVVFASRALETYVHLPMIAK